MSENASRKVYKVLQVSLKEHFVPATALIAVINRQDWLFPLVPVGIGICILVIVRIAVNNLALNRKYPNYW